MEFANYHTKSIQGHRKKVLDLSWNATGQKLVSSSSDGSIKVWNFDNQNLEKEIDFKQHKDQVDQVQWHPTDPNIFVSASSDKSIKIFDIRHQKEVKTLETIGQNINLAWRPDGLAFAVGNKDDKITFYDFLKIQQDQQQDFSFNSIEFQFEVNEMQWDRSGTVFFLTSGVEANKTSNSGQIQVLDGQNPQFPGLTNLRCHQGPSYCISISNNNQLFATGGVDSIVSLWNLQEMVCVRTFNHLEEQLRTLSFSFNDQYLATASEDLKVTVINVQNGQVFDIECQAPQNSVCWHPNQMVLAFAGEKTGNEDGLIKIFSL